uniref:protein-serine/threonine phosphatase n=1 Tax=Leersia perrieri TaxID=77586 RepID=A0A0D9XRK9_9ORYZ
MENYNGRSDTVFCGVFDGHGPHGHLIARKVRDILPLRLCDLIYEDCGDSPTSNPDGSTLEENLSPHADAECRSPTLAGQKEHQEFFNAMKESFRKAFKIVDKELRLQRNIDSICSGTTAVTLIKQIPHAGYLKLRVYHQGHDLIVGNLGDSRAVLGTRDQNDKLVARQLTVDLKPDHPSNLLHS